VISQGTPLSDLAFNRQIKSIADAISLNQKFIFIGKLFEGMSMLILEQLRI
jgi:hypothetical protein